MAIKEIDVIPQVIKKECARDMIRKDIQEALDKGISLFEFEGDYNYKYLGAYAREVVDEIRGNYIRNIQKRYKELNLYGDERKYKGFYVIQKPTWEYKNEWITISTCKGEDRRRVFCKIDDFKILEAKVIADCEEAFKHARETHRLVDGKWEWVKKGRE